MKLISCFCYRIVEIDNHQRISLAKVETGEVLKVKVPYEQIRPHVTCDLHKPMPTLAATAAKVNLQTSNETEAKQMDDQPTDCIEKPEKAVVLPQAKAEGSCQNEKAANNPSVLPQAKAERATKNQRKAEDIVIVSETKAKKRTLGPVPVKPATLKKDISQLLPIIQSGEWLSDEHIDHAQAMLKKHFPYIGGLQAVWVFISEGCQSVGTPQEDFVQILIIGGNHWITVSNIGCPKDTITIYDSLYNDISPSCKAKFLRQMAYMLMPTSKHVTLQWADMQKQKGGSDCGLYAIAVATSLCFGILPQDFAWEQGKMRHHLSMCFQQGDLSLFPQSSMVRQHQGHHWLEKVEVFCHCRQPFTENVFMVQCDNCQDWFHRGCQRIPRKVNKNTPFICKNCK